MRVVSRAHKLANLLGVTLPLVGLVAAVALLWNKWLHPVDVALLVAGYLLTGIGVTVGYHRLFTHRAFQTKQWLRWTFAILGSMAVEGPVLSWVADHRKHHQFSDQEGDPHSPHVGVGDGFWAATKNLFHAHVGWLFVAEGRAEISEVRPRPARRAWHEDDQQAVRRLARDLTARPGRDRLRDRRHVAGRDHRAALGRRDPHLPAASRDVLDQLDLPLLGPAATSVRGREPATCGCSSLISFGESWHNNHHAFPTSAFHGMRKLEAALDPGGWVITGLEKLGLAWKVVRIPDDRQAAKTLALADRPGVAGGDERLAGRRRRRVALSSCACTSSS